MRQWFYAAFASFLILLGALPAQAADGEICTTVRLAEAGWLDVSLTSNVVAEVLQALGYTPDVRLFSLEIIFAGLENKDLDVFLGDWRPSVDPYSKPYIDRGTIERISLNLTGAKYTLAVPKYVADAGVKDFADLSKFGDKFNRMIYGIEPGSNESTLKMVAEGKFGLADWTVKESSEGGMMAQVDKTYRNQEWIVFQAWEPHPMNKQYDIVYLTGGDEVFGPNLGAATVNTITRKGYLDECPNAGKLLSNVKFELDFENAGMELISKNGLSAKDAAMQMIRENPQLILGWLSGVTTADGKDAKPALSAAFGY